MQRRPHLVWWLGGLAAIALLIALPFVHPVTFDARNAAELATKTNADGFFPSQTDNLGDQYVWTAPSASTTFFLVGKRPTELRLDLRSAAYAGGPDAPIHVLVNGHEIQQVRPEPRLSTFQEFRLNVPPTAGGTLNIELQAEPFHPPNGDRRILGTMVRSISIDKSGAWAPISRRAWLYELLPILGIVAAALLWAAKVTAQSPTPTVRWSALVGYAAIVACLAAVTCMMVAVVLLVRIGRIDRYRYDLWIYSSLYLGCFAGIVAVHLPCGRPTQQNITQWLLHRPFVLRRQRLVIAIRDLMLFSLTLAVAMYFLHAPGTGDVRDKIDWMNRIASSGVRSSFHTTQGNYPPGTYLLLTVVTACAQLFPISFFVAFKLSLIVFLLLTSLVMFVWTRNALLTIAVQSALVLDSSVFGYNDVYFLPPLLLALWAISAKKPVWFTLFFLATCLIKWQPAVIAPVVFLSAAMAERKREDGRIDFARLGTTLVLPALLIVFATLAVFGSDVIDALRRGMNEHFLSADALNVHWIITNYLRWRDPQAYGVGTDTYKEFIVVHSTLALLLAKGCFAAVYLWLMYRFMKAKQGFDSLLFYAYATYLAYFMLNIGVHENHLIPAVVLAGLLWWENREFASVFIVTAAITNLNMLLFFKLNGVPRLPITVHGIDVTLFFAILNVALFTVFLFRSPLYHDESVPHAEERTRMVSI